MKVVIIGGSSQSTPALFEYLSKDASFSELKVVLVGRSEPHLLAVARAAHLLTHGDISIEVALLEPGLLEDALEGANLIILQVRIGGYAGRDYDETFPLKYKMCGDEGLGLGGISSAWRSWPQIKKILYRVDTIAPGATLLILSSPIGILVRSARQICKHVNIAGICELPWTTLNEVGNLLDANISELCFEYCGTNHLGCFYHVSVDGRDLIEAYAHLHQKALDFPSAAIIAQCSGIPMKYLRLHYMTSEVVEEQLTRNRTRAKILKELSQKAYSIFRCGTLEEIRKTLDGRPAPWYHHAVGPFMLSLIKGYAAEPFFLSVPNDGYYSHFRDDDVLEIGHRVISGRLERLSISHPIPRSITELTTSFLRPEKLACEGIIERDASYIEEALKIHPWVFDAGRIPEMVTDIIAGETLA